MSNYRRDFPPLEVVTWLNDRLGRSVNVSIKLDHRDATVLEGEGALEHWAEGADARTLSVPREDLAGWYRIGDTRLDVTDIDNRVEVAGHPGRDDVLYVSLAEGVTLQLVEQSELDDA